MAQPRWIATYRCDSHDMLSAYLRWCFDVGESLETYNIGPLPIMNHKPYATLSTQHTKSYNCPFPDCPRCKHNMGGYVFRWYSPLWDKYYVSAQGAPRDRRGSAQGAPRERPESARGPKGASRERRGSAQ